MSKLDTIVHFPLTGEWGFIMGLDKPDSLWTKEDFFHNYDKLFDKSFIDDLNSKNYTDATIFSPDKILTQILVSHSLETEGGFEKGIILRFEEIDSVWKLVTVQAIG